MPSVVPQESGAIGGIYCAVGSVKIGHLKIRCAPNAKLESSGPSRWGIGGGFCMVGTVQVGAWSGRKRFNSISSVSSSFRKRFNTKSIISGSNAPFDRAIRFNTIGSVNSSIRRRFRSFGVINIPKRPGQDLPPFQMATWQNIPDQDDGAPIFKVGSAKTGEYTDISGVPYQFVVNMAESQPTTWSMNILDPFGQYSPLRLNGDYANLMDERPFGPAGAYVNQPYGVGINYPTTTNYATISDHPVSGSSQEQTNQYVTNVTLDMVKELFVTAKVGGRLWTFRGPGTSFSSTRNWETKAFNFAWKGQDYSLLFNKENQNMQTIRSNGRFQTTMIGALREQCDKYGVRSDLSRIAADDFIIPFMNRQNGSPADWNAQLLQTLCLEWKMVNGNIFTPYFPAPLSSSYPMIFESGAVTPTFIHDFPSMSVMQEDYEGSLQAMYNQVIATRAAQGGSKTYTVDCDEFREGYTVEFDPPLSAVTHHLEYSNAGQASFIKFYNKEGALIAVHDVIFGSIGYGQNVINSGIVVGAVRAEFTWGVVPGGHILTGSPGRMVFSGVEEVESSVWGGSLFGTAIDQGPGNPAPQLRAFAENRALINAYGLRPIEIPASSLIPSQAVLQKFCNRMLFRLSRQARKATYKIPLNPFIEPGVIIREIDYSLGSLEAPLVRDRVVQACTHSFSDDPSNRYTVYSGAEYVTVR